MRRLPPTAAWLLALPMLAGCVTTVSTTASPHAFPDPPRQRSDAPASPTVQGPCEVPPFEPPRAVVQDPAFTVGTVGVELVIQPSGEVGRVDLVRSSGSPALDRALVEHLQKVRCRFQPPLAQPRVVRQEFTFRR